MRPAEIRFDEKVTVEPIYAMTEESCWTWSGAHIPNGYGSFTPATKVKKLAHRFSYERSIGPIPDGLQLDHLCRVRDCVNPAHLEPVTNAENQRRGERAQKTHCMHGHSLHDAYRWGDRGARFCRQCRAAASKKRRQV